MDANIFFLLVGGVFLFYLGYGIKGLGLFAERGWRARFGLILTETCFVFWVLSFQVIPTTEQEWKAFDNWLGAIYLIAFPVCYVIWFIHTRRAVYLWTAPAKNPPEVKEEPAKQQYVAPTPTNPGTDKIPAWKRVQLEQQAAAQDASAASDPVTQSEDAE